MSISNDRRRFVHVGTGSRANMCITAAIEKFQDKAEYVALCDTSQTRMDFWNGRIREKYGHEVPTYRHVDFEKMIEEQKPDCVIVTTKDSTHHEYIIKAMEMGCDVATEKPMTTDEVRCQAIIDAQKKTGRNVIVMFNYRYAPIRWKAKEAILNGEIGNPRQVHFDWYLDTHHGADYFHRWHRHAEDSGTLLVHKATHHFDLVNWWINSQPKEVFAFGAKSYARPETGDKLGLQNRGIRCRECPVADKCPYYLDLETYKQCKALYLEAEGEENWDGYIRDGCVFDPSIDIHDQMSVNVKYASGAHMSYSLISFCAVEGYRLAITGDKGRLEMVVGETSYISGDGSVQGGLLQNRSWLRIYPMFGEPYEVEIPEAIGGHGGGDRPITQAIFDPESLPEDSLDRAASQVDGAMSILTGIAARKSIESGKPIDVDELVKL